MSLDYSVLMDKEFTEEMRRSLDNFLIKNGFEKSKGYYFVSDPNLAIEVELVENPGSEDFWTDSDKVVAHIGFFPRAEIHFTSRRIGASHLISKKLAVKLAKKMQGVFYNHQ